jgi:hypothetical protein
MSELNDLIIDMLRRAVRALGPMAAEVVFTGGATICESQGWSSCSMKMAPFVDGIRPLKIFI